MRPILSLLALLTLAGPLLAVDATSPSATATATSPRVEYQQRVKDLPANDATSRVVLAKWCEAKQLTGERKALLEQAVTIDPDNEPARKMLGYEKVAGKWVSPGRAKAMAKHQAALQAYVKSRLDWSSATEVATAHFKLKSNCSPMVTNEIGRALDGCYDTLAKVFGIEHAGRPIPLELFASEAEYIKASIAAGIPARHGMLGYFYYQGSDAGIRAYYCGSVEQTLRTLFHECAHLLLWTACGDGVPTWANEGLAVFFESVEWDGAKLDLKAIPFERLWNLQEQLKDGAVSLNDLCRTTGPDEYTVEYYPRGWSLIYYLIYAKNGRFLKPFEGFYELLTHHQSRPDPIETFRKAFGADPDAIHDDWKTFVEQLKPAKPEEFAAAAVAATVEADFARAEDFLASARKGPADWRIDAAAATVHLRKAELLADAVAAQEIYATAADEFAKTRELKGKGKIRSLRDEQLALDQARALIGAGHGESAQDVLEGILAVDEQSAAAYAWLALERVAAKDIDGAKKQVQVADDMGAGHEAKYVHALIALADQDTRTAVKELQKAAMDDSFGFGAVFYRVLLRRLVGVKVIEEP